MNNDLLKRIDESFFFVVDADGQQKLNRLLEDCRAEIERLSQALAEPVEPVAKKLTREELSHTDGRIEFVWWKDIPHGAFIYTTPPSLDALIAEAVAKEREECARLCDDADKSTHPSDLAEAIRARWRE